jgi:hypothetical protein
VYEPVPREKQKDAMALLTREAFRTPTEVLKPEVLALIEPSGTAERVLQGQRSVLNTVLENGRLARMVNVQALPASGARPYKISEMMADLRAGVWSELAGPRVTADVYRRNLQRAYLDVFNGKLNATVAAPPTGMPAGMFAAFNPPLPGEARAMMRSELTDLDASIAGAIPKAIDREMKAHLQDCRYRIGKILNPEK